MSILEDLTTLLTNNIDVPIETGIFKDKAPDQYIVFVPISDSFGYHADNRPQIDVQEVRISIFSKKNYLDLREEIINLLLDEDYYIPSRRYIGFETDTGYHHFVIDVAKEYTL